MYHKNLFLRVGLLALIVACVPPILSVGSRAAYLAAFGTLGAMFVFAKGRRVALLVVGVVGFYLLPTLYSGYFEKAKERVEYTFVATAGEERFRLFERELILEVSAATRYRMWKRMVTEWIPDHPFIGHGVTGVGLVDTQIPRVVGEVGLVGFYFWVAMLWGIGSRAWMLLKVVQDPTEKGVVFGFFCVLMGLLLQTLGVNTFIVVRIMEPFWFLSAIVMRLYVERTAPAESPPTGPRVGSGLARAFT